MNQEQEAIIAQLKSTIAPQPKDFQSTAAHQRKESQTLTSQIQKVSDKSELNGD